MRTTALFLGCCLPALAMADTSWLGFGPAGFDRPMETSRPSFSNTPGTVTPGHILLESGYTYTYDSGGGGTSESHSVPELLLRLGLLDAVEARLGWAGYRHERSGQATVTTDGVSGLVVGVKHRFFDDTSGVRLAYLVQLALGTGSASLGEDEPLPSAIFTWSAPVTERFSLGGNINLSLPVAAGERYLETDFSLIGSGTIVGALGGFIEYYAVVPHDAPSGVATEHAADTGVTFLVGDTIQLDARIGVGLNGAADDFFTGVGFSWRH